MSNLLTFQTAGLPGNSGGLGLTFDLGPSTADLARQSFDFLADVNSTDQGFLTRSIAGSQDYLSTQLQPLTSMLASANSNMASASRALTASAQAGTSMSNVISSQVRPITKWAGDTLYPAIANQLTTTQQAINPGNIWGYANMASIYQSNAINMGYLNARMTASQQYALANMITNSQLAMVQASSGGGGGGLCFITTAICKADNKPDNCDELEAFRQFRDTYMMADEKRRELVRLYYDIAPKIVNKISASKNSDEILNKLKTDYLMPSYRAINTGDYEAAFYLYCDMVLFAAML